jgi:hypothetical protein
MYLLLLTNSAYWALTIVFLCIKCIMINNTIYMYVIYYTQYRAQNLVLIIRVIIQLSFQEFFNDALTT